MSDGGIKGAVADISEIANDAIVKPVQAEVGQLIETAQQAVTGPTDPKQIAQQQQAQAQQKQEEQKKITNIRNFFDQMVQNEQRYRAQKQQVEVVTEQVKAEEKQEVQVKEQKKLSKEEQFQKEEIIRKQSQAERKGMGGG